MVDQMVSKATRRTERGLPVPAVAIALLATVFFALPLAGLISRAPWSRAFTILRSHAVLESLRLSIVCSLCAMALSVCFGLPLAWLLARRRFFGRSIVRALCTLSMILPPVVGGVALFYALGRRGLVGQWLDRWFDIRLPFTPAAVVIAQTFVAMPFFVVTVEAAIRQADPGYDDAARTLGASSWYSFRRVTLPAIRSALVAGAVLSWARAFGEFGATITFAGSFPGKTRTLPLSVYLALDVDQPQAIMIALLMVAVSFAVLVALRDRWLGALDRVSGPAT
ncbi:MAG TPA: ABC transporter permease [Ilumatobacteraceae bacterium]